MEAPCGYFTKSQLAIYKKGYVPRLRKLTDLRVAAVVMTSNFQIGKCGAETMLEFESVKNVKSNEQEEKDSYT